MKGNKMNEINRCSKCGSEDYKIDVWLNRNGAERILSKTIVMVTPREDGR
jgi:NMD protein affecting ribosome stability and mRNA decay